MSRQNKVNPGMYTQRGRLTQDDAARELQKQRSIGSQHTWQPVKKSAMPHLAPAGDADRDTEAPADNENTQDASARVETRPAAPVKKKTTTKTGTKAAAVKATAKSSKAKTVGTGKGKKTVGHAKTAKAAKTAVKRTASNPKRNAVQAGNVRGGSKPGPTVKRQKR